MLDYAHADAQGGDQPSTLVLDAMTSKGLGYLNKSESPYSSTAVSVPAKEEKTQAHTRNEGQAVTTLLKHQKENIANTHLDNSRMSNLKSQEAAAMRISKAGASLNFGSKVVVQAQESCSASNGTRQTRKRNIRDVDTVYKENALFPNGCGTPAIKRICQEKTGTDWQTVLDVMAYGEEQ
ncbi:hypothetical protein C8R48DRAFT_672988 [Suillus tomentosus]|nr:hypothetical protein C8R48DRAFT_672988 [Suillus tomentosus]